MPSKENKTAGANKWVPLPLLCQKSCREASGASFLLPVPPWEVEVAVACLHWAA